MAINYLSPYYIPKNFLVATKPMGALWDLQIPRNLICSQKKHCTYKIK